MIYNFLYCIYFSKGGISIYWSKPTFQALKMLDKLNHHILSD